MKAVFECAVPYLQIRADQVMNRKDVFCDEATYYSKSGTPTKIEKKRVGIAIDSGMNIYNPDNNYMKSFVFCEGNNHNRLSLSDPDQIEALRRFIESREYIHEVEALAEE